MGLHLLFGLCLGVGALPRSAGFFAPRHAPVTRWAPVTSRHALNAAQTPTTSVSGLNARVEPPAVLEELLEASATGDFETLRTAVRRNLDYCDYNFINYLQSQMEAAKMPSKRDELSEIMTQVNIQLRKRLSAADDQLRAILEAGELPAMEEKLKSALRMGEVDVAFMVVLNMNMRQATEAGADTAASVLQHLYMYIQQEQDALVPGPTRLLRMLLRTECDGARENILREKLILPADLADKIGVPDEERMWGEPEVVPDDLATAIDTLRNEADGFGPEVSQLLREQCDMINGEMAKVLAGQLKGLVCETEGDCDSDGAEGSCNDA